MSQRMQRPKPFFSHPVRVSDVPRAGRKVTIEADEASRAAMASAFGLVALTRLSAVFNLSGTPRRFKVKGEVRADIRQTCVITLEDFDATVREPVDLTFSEDVPEEGAAMQNEDDGFSQREDPEPLTGDSIDLGEIAAEFLALALDPHPRKPGASFEWAEDDEDERPFASLAALRGGPPKT